MSSWRVPTRAGKSTSRQATGSRPLARGLEPVACREVDFPALVGTRQEDIAYTERPAELAGIALGERDRIRQIRALHAELPVVADVGENAGIEHVVSAERLLAVSIIEPLADMLEGEPSGHIAPRNRRGIARRDAYLEFRLPLQGRAVDENALLVAED